MKKTIFTIILFCFSNSIMAQYYSNGNFASSLEVSAGYSGDGIGTLLGYNYHLNENQTIQGAIFIALAEDKGENYTIPYNIFTVQGQFFYDVFKEPRYEKFKIAVGGGGLFGYEEINKGKENVLALPENCEVCVVSYKKI